MRSTFNLKDRNKTGETLIYLKAFFKAEGKKFVYSTGETINPKEWDFKNRMPNNLTGKSTRGNKHRSINKQINRYSAFFIEITNRYIHSGQEITIKNIRDEFDKEFKKTKSGARDFFVVYDVFVNEKINDKTDKANSTSTIKRYEYNKKLLLDFEEARGAKLTFNSIDKKFYNKFLELAMKHKIGY